MNDPHEHPEGVPRSSSPDGAPPPSPDDSRSPGDHTTASGPDVDLEGPGHGQPDVEPAGAGHGQRDVDLDAMERDLDGVEAALGRLDDGTYWTDEVTGREIPDEVLASDPTARRAP